MKGFHINGNQIGAQMREIEQCQNMGMGIDVQQTYTDVSRNHFTLNDTFLRSNFSISPGGQTTVNFGS